MLNQRLEILVFSMTSDDMRLSDSSGADVCLGRLQDCFRVYHRMNSKV